jgi:hypothetical protein
MVWRERRYTRAYMLKSIPHRIFQSNPSMRLTLYKGIHAKINTTKDLPKQPSDEIEAKQGCPFKGIHAKINTTKDLPKQPNDEIEAKQGCPFIHTYCLHVGEINKQERGKGEHNKDYHENLVA